MFVTVHPISGNDMQQYPLCVYVLLPSLVLCAIVHELFNERSGYVG